MGGAVVNHAQRENVLEDLRHPIMCGASDEALGDIHGVSARDVRRLRATLRADMVTGDTAARVSELASLIGWNGTSADLVALCVERAIARAKTKMKRRPFGGPSREQPAGLQSAGGTSGLGIRGGQRREAQPGAHVVRRDGAVPRGTRATGEGERATGKARSHRV